MVEQVLAAVVLLSSKCGEERPKKLELAGVR